ncbi:ABC transporter ATP-binding protein [Desulfitobacterium sp. Sab5]|uniref:ABC transporter ATP-binding protein n=1 Tax=Desulfitobacterium nosdiversum TaxID=3375356 RepID=UPI003CF4B88D
MVIAARGLQKSFQQRSVLNQLDINVPKGVIYGLLGENGAGKTTFMKILLGLLKPTSGEVYIFNKNVLDKDRSYLSQVGSLIETPVFYDSLTVGENLSLHCDYLQKDNHKKIPEILELVGIPGVEERKTKELSLGMKQRLAIGRALLGNPQLLILDEPINGVDPKGIIEIRMLLLRLKEEHGLTILLSSHIMNELEKIADIIAIMHGGKIVDEVLKSDFGSDKFDLEKHFIALTQNQSWRIKR